MSAEHKKVAVDVLYVYTEVRCRLSSVNHGRHAMVVSNFHDLFHWVDRAKHVAHMSNTNQFCVLVEHFLVFLNVQFPRFVHRDNPYGNALFCRLQLPRHYVGVVFHNRHNHLVALLHHLLCKRCSHEVETLGCASGEDDFRCRWCVDESSHCFSSLLM